MMALMRCFRIVDRLKANALYASGAARGRRPGDRACGRDSAAEKRRRQLDENEMEMA
jgi:hypothetical protein